MINYYGNRDQLIYLPQVHLWDRTVVVQLPKSLVTCSLVLLYQHCIAA